MFLPEFDRDYLLEKSYHFEEKIDISTGQKGLIIKNWVLPIGKFNFQSVDLLVLIPNGYPEIRPDMWYFSPAILLASTNQPARQTQVNINFSGQNWQRWSRHFPANEWRSGIDGIHTYLKKIEAALELAS